MALTSELTSHTQTLLEQGTPTYVVILKHKLANWMRRETS